MGAQHTGVENDQWVYTDVYLKQLSTEKAVLLSLVCGFDMIETISCNCTI